MIIELDWNTDGSMDVDLTGKDISISVGISEDVARKLWHDLGEMLHVVKEVEQSAVPVEYVHMEDGDG